MKQDKDQIQNAPKPKSSNKDFTLNLSVLEKERRKWT